MSLIDLWLRRLYHCTATQTAATTTAQFWNRPIVRRGTSEGIYKEGKPGVDGETKVNLNHSALYTVGKDQ